MSIQWQRPLTDAQLGIWLGQQMDTASPRYNAAEYISLRGALDVTRFEQALREVIDQCVTLHLVFRQTDEGPQQYWRQQDWALEHMDFSVSDQLSDDAFVAAQQWMQADLTTVVDLQQGPVFKQALLTLGKEHHLWYQRIHHIACDGFAFALITQNVAERYSELIADPASQHTGNIQQQLDRFDAILAEETHYRNSPAQAKDRNYWLEQLNDKGESSPGFEPDQKPGTAPKTTRGMATSFSSSPEAVAHTNLRISTYMGDEHFARLQQQAATLGASWSDALLACVVQSLYHQTAVADITLGVPVMNRMGSASLRIPSMVMNIIPLRIQLESINNFCKLVEIVGEKIKAARPHTRYRYEYLKRDLGISGTQKLFGPVVNIMPFDRPLAFARLQAQAHNLSAGPVEDISFGFVLENSCPWRTDAEQHKSEQRLHPSRLRFDLDANPNRYTPGELERIQEVFQQQLMLVLNDLNAPLQVDKEKISWLEGRPLAKPTHSVLHNIYQQIVSKPKAIALQWETRNTSYQQLAEQSAAMATALADMGLSPNKIIALVLPRSEEAITAALACWLLDCAFVFLDPDAPHERNALILANAKPSLVVSERIDNHNTSVLADKHFKWVTLQYLRHTGAVLTADNIEHLWKKSTQKYLADWHSAAYVIYTSGSTGTPKGVVIGHTALAEFVASNKDSYNIQAQDRVLQFAPLHFDACIEEIFVTLSQGARLVLRNNTMLESMPAFLKHCAEWQISLLDLPTAFWHELAFACKHLSLELPQSLRAIIIGGEAVMAERVQQWRHCFGDKVALFNTYGPSEATVIATCVNLCSREQIQSGQPISIGSPLSGRAIAVVDTHLQVLPKGEEGELLLCGMDSLEGGLAQGYLNLPEKTAQAFIPLDLPWLEHPVRAYRTGDRVKINAANQVEFIGRLDDQIKISGYRIDPLEVEAALLKLEAVREAAVVAVSGAQGDKILVAHLVQDESTLKSRDLDLQNKETENIRELRNQLKGFLPAPMLPGAVLFHSKLPRNASGKINRKELQRQSLALIQRPQQASEELFAQQHSNGISLTSQQQAIMRIWQEILGQPGIQLDDDFFALGGQSWQCIQVANRLSATLGREIPVAWLFQHPSIAALDKQLIHFVSANNAENNSSNPADSGTSRSLIEQQMAMDCETFSSKLPMAKRDRSRVITENPCILLTGATGFVGAQLLTELTKSGHKIICLVRATDEMVARERVRQALANQSLAIGSSRQKLPGNIHIQLADLEQPQLGLSNDAFLQLSSSIDLVIHNAANTSVMRDYPSLRAANALSTAELLQLASIHQVPFHLISTVALADVDEEKKRLALPEEFVPQHKYLRDGYQQSKWVAERMAAIAHEKGYAVNVYRLARVTGDLDSAYVNQKDLVWSILQAGLSIGVLPDLQFEEPWTPVDRLAQFIAQHCVKNPGAGVFNLAPPKNLSITQLYEWLAQSGQDFSLIPLTEWCAAVKQRGEPHHQPIAEFFARRKQEKDSSQDSQAGVPLTPHIEHQKFDRAAAALDLRLPVVDQQLFNRYFAYASARDWFKPMKHHTTMPEEFAV